MKCIQCYKETNLKLDIGYCKVPMCINCKRLCYRLKDGWGIPFPSIEKFDNKYDKELR